YFLPRLARLSVGVVHEFHLFRFFGCHLHFSFSRLGVDLRSVAPRVELAPWRNPLYTALGFVSPFFGAPVARRPFSFSFIFSTPPHSVAGRAQLRLFLRCHI